MKSFLVSTLLLTLLPIALTHAEITNIDEALKVAQAKQQPVFIDFSAIWCHSCHAMDDKVLNGADWDAHLNRMVLVRSDADRENGDRWSKKLRVPALPAYIVLNPDGSERGRLTGEIPRKEFYPALDRLLDGSDGVEQLKTRAAKGSVDAVVKVLEAYSEREEAQTGMEWYASLPEAVRKAVQNDAKSAAHLHAAEMHADTGAIIDLMEAPGKARTKAGRSPSGVSVPTPEQRRLSESCVQHAEQALTGELTASQRLDVTWTMTGWCGTYLPLARRKALAQAQLPAIQALFDKEVPNGGSGLLRDATHLLASLHRVSDEAAQGKAAIPRTGAEAEEGYKKVDQDGDTDPAAKAIYRRAVMIGRKALDDSHGGLDVKRDRSMGMVLAEMMHYAGLKDDRIALDKAMADAYPDDFLCQDDYGRDLLEDGKAAEALPYLERASEHANEGHRLSTAYQHAKALVALNRRGEAERLFQDAMHQEEKRFPDRAKKAKAYMKL